MSYRRTKAEREADAATNAWIKSENNKVVHAAGELESDTAVRVGLDIMRYGPDWVAKWSGAVPQNPQSGYEFSAGRNAFVMKDEIRRRGLGSASFVETGDLARPDDGSKILDIKNYHPDRHGQLKQVGRRVFSVTDSPDIGRNPHLLASSIKELSFKEALLTIITNQPAYFEKKSNEISGFRPRYDRNGDGRFESWDSAHRVAIVPPANLFENRNEFLYMLVREQCRAAAYQGQRELNDSDGFRDSDFRGGYKIRRFGIGGDEILLDMAALITCDHLGIKLDGLGTGKMPERYQEERDRIRALEESYIADAGIGDNLLHLMTDGRALSNGLVNIYTGQQNQELDIEYHVRSLEHMYERNDLVVNQYDMTNKYHGAYREMVEGRS